MVIASMTWLIALDQNSIYPIISFFIFIFYILNTIRTFPQYNRIVDDVFFMKNSDKYGLIEFVTHEKKTDFLQIIESHFDKVTYYIHLPPPQNYLDEHFDFFDRGRVNHKKLTPYTDETYISFREESGALFLYSNDFTDDLPNVLACMHFALINNFDIYIDDKKENFNFNETEPWLNLLKNT